MNPRLLAILLGVLAASCDRTHLSKAYGQATRRALSSQVIDWHAGERSSSAPVGGLDPEEAAIVADTYRKSLSPTKETQAAGRAPIFVLPTTPTPPGMPSAAPLPSATPPATYK